MDHLPRWRELLDGPESAIPLDEAALIIAGSADPTVDVPAQLERLDGLASQIDRPDTSGVCQFVFETLGLQGDRQTYEDPQNSYLHRLLDRRLGIPISLSVLLMEIARRRGVVLHGVGMPGHFLVRDPSEPELLIDAFAGGSRLDHAACAQLLQSVIGDEFEFHPGMLAPVGPLAILARMLANLSASFERRGDKDGLLWVVRLRIALPGVPLAGRVELATTVTRLGRVDEASARLEQLAADPRTSAEAAQLLRARSRGLLAPFN
jgi:regulator of sirC expression with transglutaminase-like and TPR domain